MHSHCLAQTVFGNAEPRYQPKGCQVNLRHLPPCWEHYSSIEVHMSFFVTTYAARIIHPLQVVSASVFLPLLSALDLVKAKNGQ